MKILTFTTLYPNDQNPDFGIFVKNRMIAVSKLPDVQLKVVAPIPYFPPIRFFKKWYEFSKIPKHEVIDGVEVFHPRYLVTPKYGMTFYGLWMFLGALGCLKRIQHDFSFDLIDSHFVYPDGLAAVLLGKYFKRPVIISARGTDINLYPQIPLVRNLLQWVLKSADHFISVCESLGQMMVNEGADLNKVSIVPNGINPDHFFNIDKMSARKTLGLATDKKILLSVGGLIERKGFHALVDSLSVLKKQGHCDFHTYILGKGEMHSALLDKIIEYNLQDQVHLLGHVPNQKLINWYNAADLFFLGSSREGWPNVVCEALACGTPVVATKVNGIPEIINNNALGIMVERTPEAFSSGIHEAFSRTWDNALISREGRSRTWGKVADEVHSVFFKVLLNEEN